MVVLIHVSNVLYLLSYLVKDILWLRLLTVVAGSVLLAYYVLMPVPLWAAIGWNVVFLVINIRQIQILLLERRPVRLSPDELRLHQLAFRSLTQREFAKLLRLAKWEDVAADGQFVTKGQPLERLMVIADGRACVMIAGVPGIELRPGCFVGEMSYLTGQTPNADVVATQPTRLVTWLQSELRKFLGQDAELRAIVQTAIGEDLVAKLGYSRAS